MHILLIPSWYPRHSADPKGCFFREQAIALRDAGHKVGVLAVDIGSAREWRNLFRKFGRQFELDSDIRTHRFTGMVWPARFPGANTAFWRVFGWLLFRRYVMREGMPDIVHVHGMLYGGVLGRMIGASHGLPLVVTEHSTFYARGLLSPGQLRTAASVAHDASALLAVSGSLCRELSERFPRTPASWEELPNIVDSRFFLPRTSPPNGASAFVFLAVALLTEIKGINILLQAFARAFAGSPVACLRIGGDGIDRGRLELLAEDLRIAQQVTFLGMLSRDQVASEMAAADVFVLPSHYETFGVVVAEALACGTPVVATRCGGPESIVRPQDGILVPVNDVPEMTGALIHMHRAHHQFDAAEIRAACLARYGPPTIARRLTSLYERLVNVRIAEARA